MSCVCFFYRDLKPENILLDDRGMFQFHSLALRTCELQRGQSGLFMWACFMASLIFVHHGSLDVNHQSFGAAQQSCRSFAQKIFSARWLILNNSIYRCHLLTSYLLMLSLSPALPFFASALLSSISDLIKCVFCEDLHALSSNY